MALHTTLQIYKSAYDLLGHSIDVVKQMPRDFKAVVGERIVDRCLAITTLVGRTNRADLGVARMPYLDALLEHVQETETLLRISVERRHISRREIEAFLPRELGIHLNPAKTILQPVDRGVDFVGQVIKPWYRRIRPRVVSEAMARTRTTEDLFTTANSYFGLLRQAPASHHDRALLANVVRQRGHAVNRNLTKALERSLSQGGLAA